MFHNIFALVCVLLVTFMAVGCGDDFFEIEEQIEGSPRQWDVCDLPDSAFIDFEQTEGRYVVDYYLDEIDFVREDNGSYTLITHASIAVGYGLPTECENGEMPFSSVIEGYDFGNGYGEVRNLVEGEMVRIYLLDTVNKNIKGYIGDFIVPF